MNTKIYIKLYQESIARITNGIKAHGIISMDAASKYKTDKEISSVEEFYKEFHLANTKRWNDDFGNLSAMEKNIISAQYDVYVGNRPNATEEEKEKAAQSLEDLKDLNDSDLVFENTINEVMEKLEKIEFDCESISKLNFVSERKREFYDDFKQSVSTTKETVKNFYERYKKAKESESISVEDLEDYIESVNSILSSFSNTKENANLLTKKLTYPTIEFELIREEDKNYIIYNGKQILLDSDMQYNDVLSAILNGYASSYNDSLENLLENGRTKIINFAGEIETVKLTKLNDYIVDQVNKIIPEVQEVEEPAKEEAEEPAKEETEEPAKEETEEPIKEETEEPIKEETEEPIKEEAEEPIKEETEEPAKEEAEEPNMSQNILSNDKLNAYRAYKVYKCKKAKAAIFNKAAIIGAAALIISIGAGLAFPAVSFAWLTTASVAILGVGTVGKGKYYDFVRAAKNSMNEKKLANQSFKEQTKNKEELANQLLNANDKKVEMDFDLFKKLVDSNENNYVDENGRWQNGEKIADEFVDNNIELQNSIIMNKNHVSRAIERKQNELLDDIHEAEQILGFDRNGNSLALEQTVENTHSDAADDEVAPEKEYAEEMLNGLKQDFAANNKYYDEEEYNTIINNAEQLMSEKKYLEASSLISGIYNNANNLKPDSSNDKVGDYINNLYTQMLYIQDDEERKNAQQELDKIKQAYESGDLELTHKLLNDLLPKEELHGR